MDEGTKKYYQKKRAIGLDFIRDEIIAERYIDERDKEYLAALLVVENKINVMIARESNETREEIMEIKYPKVTVKRLEEDGNDRAIIWRVTGAMRRAGVSIESIKEYIQEAESGDYSHLIKTTKSYINVE